MACVLSSLSYILSKFQVTNIHEKMDNRVMSHNTTISFINPEVFVLNSKSIDNVSSTDAGGKNIFKIKKLSNQIKRDLVGISISV